MSAPDRWARVEALVPALLQLPPDERDAFLTRELGQEGELRAEVLSLVEHATTDPDFLQRLSERLVGPALVEALGGRVDTVPAPEEALRGVVGDRYRIEGRSGSGGAGIVYRATDQRLDRTVALKILPAGTWEDPVVRERFVAEARAASALDHPNIATVHDIVEGPDGRDFIVMPHYEGDSLRELLRDGPLPLPRVCDLGLQVASGLDAAHRQHIVHCDIKPDNVVVTEDGTAKIVDFGLARLGSEGASGTSRIGGTLPYMSPEQVRNEVITPCTDVWALGVTLYEAATGRRPFSGGGGPGQARAILHAEVSPPSAVRSGLPTWFDRIVLGCLRKDPTDRYADAESVRLDLEAGYSSIVGPGSYPRGRWARVRSAALPAAALALVLLLSAVVIFGLSTVPDAPRFTSPSPLTVGEGLEDFASWSPDADAVLYQGVAGGEIFHGGADVFLRRLGAEAPRVLTGDHDGFDGHPSWSPDGRRFAFYSDRQGGGYFVRDLDGGPARRVWSGRPPGGGHNAAVWSPDGSELAVTVDDASAGARLEIVSATDGSPLRRLPLPGRPGNLRFGTTWSPDGRFFALADAMNLTPDESRLWVMRAEDGVSFPVTSGRDLAWSPTWGPDGRTLFFVSDRGGSRDLWTRTVGADGRPRGEPREITTGIGMRNAALSADGRYLVYSKGRLTAQVWKAPIPEREPVGWEHAERITSDRAYVEFVEVDPRTGTLLMSSDRAGNQDLWTLEIGDMARVRRLTADPSPDWAPALSPDGSRIAYYSARSGNRDVWVHSLQDRTDTQITRHEAIDFVPSWSPGGDRLVFASGRSGNLDIWTIGVDGRDPVQLTTHEAMDAWPHWSPDGREVVFRSDRDGTWRLWRVPAEGGTPRVVTRVPATYFRWSGDGGTLYLVSHGQIWSHDLATGQERQLTELEPRQGSLGVVALATDDRHLYFTWEEDIGDLWVMERGR